MNQETANRNEMITYLLSTMPDSDRLALAERYFTDEDLFDQLLEIESDLIDQYVRGQLSADERQALERYLSRLPDGQYRLAVASALMKAPSEERSTAILKQTSHATVSRWRLFLAGFRQLRPAFQYGLLAGVLMLGIAVVWILINDRQPRRENSRLRAMIPQVEAEQEMLRRKAEALQQRYGEQRDRVGQLESDLDHERQENVAQALEIAKLQSTPSVVASLELTPALRALSTSDILHVTSRTKYVILRVPIEGREEYAGYRAVIQNTEGKLVWERKWTRAPSSGMGKAVFLQLSLSQLPPASYKLTLILNAPNGTEFARDYYFTVVIR